MRTIYLVLITAMALLALLLAAASALRAQGQQPALQGLPEFGVTLTGSPQNPIVENHSGKTVIGYVVKFADTHGRGEILNQLMAHSPMQPAGIPDGGSLYAKGAVPVNSTVGMSLPTHLVSRGQGPIAIVRAILQSVIFADGHFVGVDGGPGGFDLFGEKIKAFTEVGTLAKTGAWDQVEALVPRRLPGSPPSGEDYIVYTFRQLAATHLVQERKRKGDAAATELANIFSTLPTLWK